MIPTSVCRLFILVRNYLQIYNFSDYAETSYISSGETVGINIDIFYLPFKGAILNCMVNFIVITLNSFNLNACNTCTCFQ